MDEPDIEDASAAASVTDADQLSPAYKTAFAKVVEDALQNVFEIDDEEAAKRVAVYFDQDGGPSLFAYHRNPVQIAADLVRAPGQELTPYERERFIQYLRGPRDAFGLPKSAPPPRDESFPMTSSW